MEGDYDPDTAQFLTVDPLLDRTRSPYGYTHGNPLQYTDPLGLDWRSDLYHAGLAVSMAGSPFASVLLGVGDWDDVNGENIAVNALQSYGAGSVDTISSMTNIGLFLIDAGFEVPLIGNPNTCAPGYDWSYGTGATVGPHLLLAGGRVSSARASGSARSADALLPGLPAGAPRPLGLGSTGRTAPANLKEQLAMEAVRSNPAGEPLRRVVMHDPRWPATDGWVKMQQIENGVNVHYVRNIRLGSLTTSSLVVADAVHL